MNSIDRRLAKLQAKVSRERGAEREHESYFDITLVEAPHLLHRPPRSWRSAAAGATIARMHDRPTESEEIEITPEMIEAGATVIWSAFCDSIAHGSETGRAVATEVYRAMSSLRESVRDERSAHNRRA
jgi:hypothetical protein